MGHRAEKSVFGSMKNMRRIAAISKVSVAELKAVFCKSQPRKKPFRNRRQAVAE